MDESSFETLADRTLADLQARIETALEDMDADVDLRGGILTIELEDGRQYVINKHAPNRQIWLSSPISGAGHYSHDGASGQWRSTRGSEVLHEVLAAELTTIAGRAVTFD
jgi:frataxin